MPAERAIQEPDEGVPPESNGHLEQLRLSGLEQTVGSSEDNSFTRPQLPLIPGLLARLGQTDPENYANRRLYSLPLLPGLNIPAQGPASEPAIDIMPTHVSRVGDLLRGLPVMEIASQEVQPTLAVRSIPTLDEDDSPGSSLYKCDDEAVKIYDKVKDSIVRLEVYYESWEIDDNKKYASGTGFFIEDSGTLVTAHHVVDESPKRIIARLPDGRVYDAKVLESKRGSDMATLRIEANPGERFASLELADTSRTTKKEQSVFIVGHPHGWEDRFLSKGTLQSRESLRDRHVAREMQINPERIMLSTNAASVPGSSGSPLVNEGGKVIGVVSFGNKDGAIAGNVEELHGLLGDATISDYLPHSFTVDRATIGNGLRLISTGGYTAFAKYNNLGRIGGTLMAFNAAGSAAIDLYTSDYQSFTSSWTDGSAAEKFSATTNFLGDLSMIGGGIGMSVVGKKYRFAAGLIATSGSGAKFVNHLLADRAY